MSLVTSRRSVVSLSRTPSGALSVSHGRTVPRLVALGTPWCRHWRHGRCLASWCPLIPNWPRRRHITSLRSPRACASPSELPGLGSRSSDQRSRACAAFVGVSGPSFHSRSILEDTNLTRGPACPPAPRSGHRSLSELDECPLGTEALCLLTADSFLELWGVAAAPALALACEPRAWPHGGRWAPKAAQGPRRRSVLSLLCSCGDHIPMCSALLRAAGHLLPK